VGKSRERPKSIFRTRLQGQIDREGHAGRQGKMGCLGKKGKRHEKATSHAEGESILLLVEKKNAPASIRFWREKEGEGMVGSEGHNDQQKRGHLEFSRVVGGQRVLVSEKEKGETTGQKLQKDVNRGGCGSENS